MQILNSVEERWGDMYNDVHGAAFVLDPEYVWMDHKANPDAWGSFKSMVSRMYAGKKEATEIYNEYDAFKAREEKAELKDPVVWQNASVMPANVWWDNFGTRLPALQKLAMRVLTAPVSSSAGERNWSAYNHVISERRTRLTSERAKQLVYIYTNSRVLKKNMLSFSKEAFEWDEVSMAWLNETFPWQKEERESDEVACDVNGKEISVVNV